MTVYCVFKHTYNEPELINIYQDAVRAQEDVDMLNSMYNTEDYFIDDWEMCP